MLVSFFVMYSIKKNINVALVFSILYSFSAYRTADIFQRAALGEAVSFVFLPIILLGCYELCIGNYKKWYILTIGMTLLVYTHLLSVAMAAVFIAIVILSTFYFWKEKLLRLYSFFLSTITTVFLSSAFLIPFLEQQLAQDLKMPTWRELNGRPLGNLVNDILNNDLSSYTIGLLLFFGIIITILNNHLLIYNYDKFIFGLGIILLLCTTDIFPWKPLINTFVSNLQFVWRLNAFASLFLAYSFSLCFKPNKNDYKIRSIVSMFLFIIVLHNSSIINLNNKNEDTAVFLNSHNIVEKAKTSNSKDYATLKSVTYPELIENNIFYLNDKIIEPDFYYNDDHYIVQLENNSSVNQDLKIPVYRYLGQQVRVNNEKTNSRHSEFGTTEVTVPPGGSTVKIYYKYTNLAILSRYFTGVWVALFIFYLGVVQNKKIKRESQ